MVKIEKRKKNINIDGSHECDLLCKLIVDYIPSNSVKLYKNHYEDENKTKIKYLQLELDPGNFINYKDTSYESTRCVFFHPSRHTIDGEQFDFELNIYHGSFSDKLGYSTHYHYHQDTDDRGVEYHQHSHYHKEGLENDEKKAHENHTIKNIVLCLLFNKGDHKGTRINTFFDQFVHADNFEADSNSEYDKITTHKHFSFDDILPRRRSFFNYEGDNNLDFIVFDYIQTIDKGILDIFIDKKIGFIPIEDTDNTETVLYKKNIEVITDERYKKLVRLQIKDLVSMTRVVQSKPPADEPREYYKRADDIYSEVRPGGAFYNYQTDQENSIDLANQWESWGRGNDILKPVAKIMEEKLDDTDDYIENYFGKIKFSRQNRNYLELFESIYKKQIIDEIKKCFNKIVLNILDYNEGTDSFEYKDQSSKESLRNDLLTPNLLNYETIRKNLYLYNKIFILKDVKKLGLHTRTIRTYNMGKKYRGRGATVRRKNTRNIISDLNDLLDSYFKYKPNLKNSLKSFNIIKDSSDENGIFDINIINDYVLPSKDGIIFEKLKIDMVIDKYYNSNKASYEDDVQAKSLVEVYTDNNFGTMGITQIENEISNFNLSGDILTSNDKQHLFVYGVFDIGKFFSSSPTSGKDIDLDLLNTWRYFIALNELNEDYINELNIFEEENFIINNFNLENQPNNFNLGNQLINVKDGKTYDDLSKGINGSVTNDELFNYDNMNNTYNLDKENSIVTSITNPADDENITSYLITGTIPMNYHIIMFRIISFLNNNTKGKNIFFLDQGPQMNTTIDGDQCQNWNSNEIHYEGSLFDIFKNLTLFPKNGKIWAGLDQSERQLLHDGLLVARGGDGITYNATDGVINTAGDENEGQIKRIIIEEKDNKEETTESQSSPVKWASHNFCRNPGNTMPAPWCYTKNPKVRWQYCINPDYSQMIARITLIIAFVFVIILAYLSVKRIFENELFTAFVARLTGAQVSEGSGGPKGSGGR